MSLMILKWKDALLDIVIVAMTMKSSELYNSFLRFFLYFSGPGALRRSVSRSYRF